MTTTAATVPPGSRMMLLLLPLIWFRCVNMSLSRELWEDNFNPNYFIPCQLVYASTSTYLRMYLTYKPRPIVYYIRLAWNYYYYYYYYYSTLSLL